MIFCQQSLYYIPTVSIIFEPYEYYINTCIKFQEFEKQSEIMDMKEEMMNDSIDEAMEGDDDEEERYVF